jgi:hypothetical protein
MAGNLNTHTRYDFSTLKNYEDKLEEISLSLVEEDIPGASLNGNDPRTLTVKQLKFWLSCRGAKISGKKDELVMRVNNYNAVPELRNKIVDPDPDKSFTRYKFEEILKKNGSVEISASGSNPFSPQSFPTDDSEYSDDLTVLPNFNPGDLYNLAKNSGKNLIKYKNVPVVDKPVDKGFFMKNFVHDLQTCPKENYVYVRAKCWASMCKSKEYQIKLVVEQNGNEPKIKYAICDKNCPARYVISLNSIYFTLQCNFGVSLNSVS